MVRRARSPPAGTRRDLRVELNLAGQEIKAKGPKGEMAMQLHPEVELQIEDGTAKVTARSGSKFSVAMSGGCSDDVKPVSP